MTSREEPQTGEIQVSYDISRKDGDLTVAVIGRVFENGFKVLCSLQGDDALAFIVAWNARHTPAQPSQEPVAWRWRMKDACGNVGAWSIMADGTKPEIYALHDCEPLYVSPISSTDRGAGWIDQNHQIDRYGVALMMIREGCSDPAGLARRILSEFEATSLSSNHREDK